MKSRRPGERKITGSLTGNSATSDATLRFSALTGVSAMIETVPLQEAAAAYAKMMAGKARFRIVLVMNNGASEGRLGNDRSKVAVSQPKAQAA